MLFACSGKTQIAGSGEPDLGEVTFYEDVAPILYENCVSCHQPGSIAPFSLIGYDSAKQVGSAIALHTAERHMPPMPVDNSGECNTYSNARWLTDTEIATLAAWVEQGSLEGDPAAAPELPEPPAGLTAPSVTLEPAAEYLPNAAVVADWRCFILPVAQEEDSYATAYQFIPRDPTVVHHVLIHQPGNDAETAKAVELDAAEEGEGYTCYGGPQINSNLFAMWAPGGGVLRTPEGTGIRLVGGRPLILQIHYTPKEGGLPDRSQLLLELVSSVAAPARFMPINHRELRLEPGLALAETGSTITPPPRSVTVYGAGPHMHSLGRTLRVEVQAGGATTCLVNVDRWSFHWQNFWWYNEPISFAKIDSGTIRCGYDTSQNSEVVVFGQNETGEMCLNYLYVTTQ